MGQAYLSELTGICQSPPQAHGTAFADVIPAYIQLLQRVVAYQTFRQSICTPYMLPINLRVFVRMVEYNCVAIFTDFVVLRVG